MKLLQKERVRLADVNDESWYKLLGRLSAVYELLGSHQHLLALHWAEGPGTAAGVQ